MESREFFTIGRVAQAEAGAPVLRQIGWYADQVLAEYAGLEQRARDLQALNDKLLWRDRLARTAAHDMRNKLAMPMERSWTAWKTW